ncbi:O(6)-methylguanine-induced apoptosis 2 isoform X2 [Embiotoca jacksoni]|uniref:O(6)-methylguanine-induced apoptosis 2 isoform X2 n=1 Tax=Embiotoca jacksoni TaxID=100190 RepID=UPI0037043C8D
MYRGISKKSNPGYTTSPSIPTKYQKVLPTPQEKKKGFSSQEKRFSSLVRLNENPGPGSYACMFSAEVNSPSFSKKGTAGFVAHEVTRKPHGDSPGPDKYNMQSSFINKYDFNTGVSRVFRMPVALHLDGPKDKTPAPNQYDVVCKDSARISTVVGTSSFLSKTTRRVFGPPKTGPPPGHYELSDRSIQKGSKALLSPFKSKTRRIAALVDNHVPGPAAYSPHQMPVPVKRTLLPRGYYPPISRPVAIVPKDPPLPGPGQYDVGSYAQPSKHPKPTAAFASRTDRTPRKSSGDIIPGPDFYHPQDLSKQSFFYCNSKVWIPA